MPGKHVHFAPENVFYSPMPSTPSPTFSELSLPESSGPITPPPIKKHGSPYSCTPLPPADVTAHAGCYPAGSVSIHPALACGPAINYDMTLDPRSVTLAGKRAEGLTSRVLAEPATYPPLASMELTVKGFPWSIRVLPYSQKPSAYVTVADVFHALSRSLRTAVTSEEYSTLLRSSRAQQEVNEAFERRYRRLAMTGNEEAYRVEKLKGVKRVDFLGTRTRWMGLSWTSAGPDVWEVNVS
jgi:hypothetical protein